MSKYTNAKCIICQNLFQESDDVVVCPDCGTPYHRSCYRTKGACINTELHASGESWQKLEDAKRLSIGGTECPVCRHVNLPGAKTCAVCKTVLREEEPAQNSRNPENEAADTFDEDAFFRIASDPCCGLPPEEEIGGEKVEDIAGFVKNNTMYYIPLFKRFKETGSPLSVNLPCILFPYLYFANRKMWLMTILSILLTLLVDVPTFLASMQEIYASPDFISSVQQFYGEEILSVIHRSVNFLNSVSPMLGTWKQVAFLVDLAARFLLCIFGNWLYYRFVIRKVRNIRKSGYPEELAKRVISVEGGTSFWNMLGAVGIHYGGIMLLCAGFLLLFL